MYNVCVLTSGGGGNLNAILVHSLRTKDFQVNRVLVDRRCAAMDIAESFGIACNLLIDTDPGTYFRYIPADTNLLVLAGFMPIVPKEVCDFFEGNFINTHPSLLPKFGGRGMYGVRVQEAVLRSKEKLAGCTVHRVNSEIDDGEILEQARIEIPPGIDAWTLGGLVFELETQLLPKVISKFANGSI